MHKFFSNVILLFSQILVIYQYPFSTKTKSKNLTFKYCIIGAGPAGLQMAYLLKSRQRSYVIFERERFVGSFFAGFSNLNFMTSINKRFTGSKNTEYNLRFDWNSLLSDNDSLKFTKYSTRYLPLFDEYYKYLQDFYVVNGLNVLFSTEIVKILQENDGFLLFDRLYNQYLCEEVIMANGKNGKDDIFTKNSEKVQFYDCADTIARNKSSDFINKHVGIYFDSDTNFQLASFLSQITASTTIITKEKSVAFAFNSHYLGDIRSVNLHLVDSYQLKSLDIINTFPVKDNFGHFDEEIEGNSLKLLTHIFLKEKLPEEFIECNAKVYDFKIMINLNIPFERISPFFPNIDASYNSFNVKKIYFIGAISHSVDRKISNGGQINGFRYIIRYVHRMMELTSENIPWSSIRYPLKSLIDIMLKRINEASGLFRMPFVLGDFYIINKDNTFTLIDEFSTFNLHNLERDSGCLVQGPVFLVRFEFSHLEIKSGYNYGFSGKRLERNIHSADKSELLHPVVYYFDTLPTLDDNILNPMGIHHQMDDIYLKWSTLKYNYFPLKRFIHLWYNSIVFQEDIFSAMIYF